MARIGSVSSVLQVLRGDRVLRGLPLPVDRHDPPPLSVVEQLKAVDAALERPRVGRGVPRLVRAEDVRDVPVALRRWHEAGLKIAIFSSGSVLAQKLLFAHTTAGDLTQFIQHGASDPL